MYSQSVSYVFLQCFIWMSSSYSQFIPFFSTENKSSLKHESFTITATMFYNEKDSCNLEHIY